MATSRSLLAINKLEDFSRFCEERGWEMRYLKGTYEVLRMKHKEVTRPLIVYRKSDATEHLTVHGNSLKLARAFVKATQISEEAKS